MQTIMQHKPTKCTFRWFMLHNFITMHGAKNHKIGILTIITYCVFNTKDLPYYEMENTTKFWNIF